MRRGGNGCRLPCGPSRGLPSWLTGWSPRGLPRGFSRRLPRWLPGGPSRGLPCRLPRRPPRGLPRGFSRRLPHGLPRGPSRGLPGWSSGRLLRGLSRGFSCGLHRGLPRGTSRRPPRRLPRRQPRWIQGSNIDGGRHARRDACHRVEHAKGLERGRLDDLLQGPGSVCIEVPAKHSRAPRAPRIGSREPDGRGVGTARVDLGGVWRSTMGVEVSEGMRQGRRGKFS